MSAWQWFCTVMMVVVIVLIVGATNHVTDLIHQNTQLLIDQHDAITCPK
jgi:hypothetical protein